MQKKIIGLVQVRSSQSGTNNGPSAFYTLSKQGESDALTAKIKVLVRSKIPLKVAQLDSFLDEVDPPTKSGFYAIHAAASSKDPKLAIKYSKLGLRSLVSPSNKGTFPVHLLIRNEKLSFKDIMVVLKSLSTEDCQKILHSSHTEPALRHYKDNRSISEVIAVKAILFKGSFDYLTTDTVLTSRTNSNTLKDYQLSDTAACFDLLAVLFIDHDVNIFSPSRFHSPSNLAIELNSSPIMTSLKDNKVFTKKDFQKLEFLLKTPRNTAEDNMVKDYVVGIIQRGYSSRSVLKVFGDDNPEVSIPLKLNTTSKDTVNHDLNRLGSGVRLVVFKSYQSMTQSHDPTEFFQHVGLMVSNDSDHTLIHILESGGVKVDDASAYFQRSLKQDDPRYFNREDASSSISVIKVDVFLDHLKHISGTSS
jgi:hypothetical protein